MLICIHKRVIFLKLLFFFFFINNYAYEVSSSLSHMWGLIRPMHMKFVVFVSYVRSHSSYACEVHRLCPIWEVSFVIPHSSTLSLFLLSLIFFLSIALVYYCHLETSFNLFYLSFAFNIISVYIFNDIYKIIKIEDIIYQKNVRKNSWKSPYIKYLGMYDYHKYKVIIYTQYYTYILYKKCMFGPYFLNYPRLSGESL